MEYLFDGELTYTPERRSLDPGQKKFSSQYLGGEKENYELHPAYEDKNNSIWLSGTASYFLKQGNVNKYVLKTIDFSAYENYETAKQSLESGNARIKDELRTLRRLNELKPNPITELVCPEPLPEIEEQESLWLKVRWPDQQEFLEVQCFVKIYEEGYSLREWCQYRVFGDSRNPPPFRGLTDIRDWFEVGSAIAEALRYIHRGRIIHGYLSPDNIIIGTKQDKKQIQETKKLSFQVKGTEQDKKQIQESKSFIFFTNTEQFSLPPVEGAKANMLLRLYDAPEKCKPSLASEWYSPADVFSLGMVLLFLAIGDDLEDAVAGDLRVFDQIERVRVEEKNPGEEKPWNEKPGWYKIQNYGKYRERHELVTKLLDALMWRENEKGELLPREFKLDGKIVPLERRREMAIRLSTVMLNCIEPRIEHRAPTLRGVLRQMNLFAPPYAGDNDGFKMRVDELRDATEKTFRSLGDLWKQGDLLHRLQEPAARFLQPAIGEGLPLPLTAVLVTRLGLFLSDCDDVGFLGKKENLSLRITAGREHLVETMLATLSCLKNGDICEALLTPTFWYDENMGEYGRVLRMLELAVLAGAKVNWILVVNASRLQQPRVRDVLRYRSELSVELEKMRTDNKNFSMAHDPLKYAVLHDDWYYRIAREKLSHIRLPKGEDMERGLTIAPNFAGDGQKLTTLRLWVDDIRNPAYIKEFKDVAEVARPLRKYHR